MNGERPIWRLLEQLRIKSTESINQNVDSESRQEETDTKDIEKVKSRALGN